jgi:hypothetical protein
MIIMSDTDFVDIGDELVLSVSGYPAAKAVVTNVHDGIVYVTVHGEKGSTLWLNLPLDFKDYDTVDGVNHHAGVEYGHHSQPLDGVNG